MSRLLLVVPFIAVALGVLVGGHWYIATRMVRESGLPEPWQTPLLWLVALLGASLILQPIGERVLRPPWTRLVAWPASLWMGVFFLLVVSLGATDLLLALGGAVAGGDPAALGPARAAVVALVVAAAAAMGLRQGLAGPELKRVELELPRWPRERDGYRVVQISDIHIGPILDRRFAAELVERVNALEPDLIAVTGDLVDGSVSKLSEEVEPFRELRARDGVFFVTGNHDHYSGVPSWTDRVAELGMRVMRNERVTIGDPARADVFELAGVDDHRQSMMPGEGGEDLDAALAGAPADRALLLLAHDPSTFKRASLRGVDLQLSGHTHGGQIWPFSFFVRMAIPFVAGHYRRGDAQLYVSRGTGFWGPPMRLRAPAEITELTLRAPAAPESSAIHH